MPAIKIDEKEPEQLFEYYAQKFASNFQYQEYDKNHIDLLLVEISNLANKLIDLVIGELAAIANHPNPLAAWLSFWNENSNLLVYFAVFQNLLNEINGAELEMEKTSDPISKKRHEISRDINQTIDLLNIVEKFLSDHKEIINKIHSVLQDKKITNLNLIEFDSNWLFEIRKDFASTWCIPLRYDSFNKGNNLYNTFLNNLETVQDKLFNQFIPKDELSQKAFQVFWELNQQKDLLNRQRLQNLMTLVKQETNISEKLTENMLTFLENNEKNPLEILQSFTENFSTHNWINKSKVLEEIEREIKNLNFENKPNLKMIQRKTLQLTATRIEDVNAIIQLLIAANEIAEKLSAESDKIPDNLFLELSNILHKTTHNERTEDKKSNHYALQLELTTVVSKIAVMRALSNQETVSITNR